MDYGIDGNMVNVIWISLAFVGAMLWLACWTVVALFRARKPKADLWAKDGNLELPPMFEKLVDKAMAKRDSEQQQLKQRLATLEKIVVDSHQRVDLSGAIDELRSQE